MPIPVSDFFIISPQKKKVVSSLEEKRKIKNQKAPNSNTALVNWPIVLLGDFLFVGTEGVGGEGTAAAAGFLELRREALEDEDGR